MERHLGKGRVNSKELMELLTTLQVNNFADTADCWVLYQAVLSVFTIYERSGMNIEKYK
jgi:hypothetical protein